MSMDADAAEVAAAETLMSLRSLDPDALLAELQDDTVGSAFADALGGALEGMRDERPRRGGVGVKRKAEDGAEGSSEASAPPSASAAAAVAASNASAASPESGQAAKRTKFTTVVDSVKAKIAQVRPYAVTGLTTAAAAAALNRPTVYGNLARLVAEIIKSTANAGITSTWGDWAQAIIDIGHSIGVVGDLAYQQSVQGPVVPLSIATAIMAYRAQKARKSLKDLIEADAAAVAGGLRSLVQSQVDAFNAVVRAEGLRSNVATLKLIAQRARQNAPLGQGAADLTAIVTSIGAPAVRSSGPVQNLVTGPLSAPIDALASADPAAVADARAARAAAGALLALADGVAPAAPASAGPAASAVDDDRLGGRRRRKTRKGRKPRRRATLRRKRATRKAPRFIY